MKTHVGTAITTIIWIVLITTVIISYFLLLVDFSRSKHIEFELLEYYNKSGKVIVETDRIESIQKIIHKDEKIVAISTKNGEWHMVDYSYDEVKDIVGW